MSELKYFLFDNEHLYTDKCSESRFYSAHIVGGPDVWI